jgi:hypothetical protein
VAIAFLALTLGGCSMSSLDSFSVADLNPLKGDDPLRSSDYNYFYRQNYAARGGGAVTAADLVGPDGRCAFEAAPAAPSSYPAGEPVASASPRPGTTNSPRRCAPARPGSHSR